MLRYSPLLLALSACGPTLLVANVANPATSPTKVESTQEYDIGPYKENHRYEVTLGAWSPSAIAAKIKLVDIDRCAYPKSYTFNLVDDRGGSYPFRPTGEAEVKEEKGRQDQQLHVATLAGDFGANIGVDVKYVTIEMRPLQGLYCPKLDFRWNLK